MKYIVYRRMVVETVGPKSSAMKGSSRLVYGVYILLDDEEYTVFPPPEDADIIMLPNGMVGSVKTGEVRSTISPHITIYDYVENSHGQMVRSQKDLLTGEFIGAFDNAREAHRTRKRLTSVADVMTHEYRRVRERRHCRDP